ncbi:MAG TPA: hypothetical protein VM099_03665 [Gemmatimonadaceae bacterium]|nr:hypothetical protein [Gemmatimonadaceae bacterium]
MTEDSIDEKKLSELMAEVAQLPRSIDAPAGSWAKIRAEIEARPVRTAWWQRPVFLAAAALTLVAGSSIITATALARRQPAAAIRTYASDSVNGVASLAQFTAVETDYIRAVNDLTSTLESDKGTLSPETIEKLRASIKVIDAAILEARNALATDPANRTLMQILANSYEQKVDLLKRTTEMARG